MTPSPSKAPAKRAGVPPLRHVEKEIRRQLQPGTAGDKTVFDQYEAQRRRLREASSPSEHKAEMARLGGVVKAWRHFLVQTITQAALGDARPGRQKTRQWQQANFGQALASSELRQYAQEERNGGGRGEEIQLSNEINDKCAGLYQRYMNALKRSQAAAGPAGARYPRPE
jgi:hypothetical protein